MKFIMPFSYAFLTRNKSIYYKISFIFVIVIPIIFTSFWGSIVSLNKCIIFILAFIALYSTYEIGYIFNDTYTVRFEKKPTIRLSPTDFKLVDRSANILISVRFLYVIIILVALNHMEAQNLNSFALMLGLLNLSYGIHNYYRNRINIISIFFVVLFKYISVPVLFMSLEAYSAVLISLLFAIPLIRTIEFAAKDKYKIKLFRNFKFDQFRIIYYAILTLFFTAISFYNENYVVGLVLSIYFLMFRFFSILILHTEIIGNSIKKIRKDNMQ